MIQPVDQTRGGPAPPWPRYILKCGPQLASSTRAHPLPLFPCFFLFYAFLCAASVYVSTFLYAEKKYTTAALIYVSSTVHLAHPEPYSALRQFRMSETS